MARIKSLAREMLYRNMAASDFFLIKYNGFRIQENKTPQFNFPLWYLHCLMHVLELHPQADNKPSKIRTERYLFWRNDCIRIKVSLWVIASGWAERFLHSKLICWVQINGIINGLQLVNADSSYSSIMNWKIKLQSQTSSIHIYSLSLHICTHHYYYRAPD